MLVQEIRSLLSFIMPIMRILFKYYILSNIAIYSAIYLAQRASNFWVIK